MPDMEGNDMAGICWKMSWNIQFNAFQAVHHQWLKYVEIVTKYVVEVDKGHVDPQDLQLYTSQTFMESNRHKMERRFNVTWMDFLTGMSIPELAIHEYNFCDGFTVPSAFHVLLCGEVEDFCGFMSVKHSDASLSMVDRYLEKSMIAWCTSKDLVLHGQAIPDLGPSETQERLVIRLPAMAKMKNCKKEDTVTETRAPMRKGKEKAPIQVDIEDVPSQSTLSDAMAKSTQHCTTTVNQTVKQFGTLTISIEKDKSIGTQPRHM
ncbi:uncharacterized protein BJ212DRAFT_1298653 [Suillus subaureus]|uniref:Uncharacterized protein n=1 Tax=Suillus subaureus TaxID=48587 RepID=A0A9P7EDU5_9AGAM|nr:uncharacterized protein BJ212DRAFT_1298653 [Suillus subaureus]KAG1818574.1 hypothetical protein BJ212DRAFT_1298653 [Suillus subaureus]